MILKPGFIKMVQLIIENRATIRKHFQDDRKRLSTARSDSGDWEDHMETIVLTCKVHRLPW